MVMCIFGFFLEVYVSDSTFMYLLIHERLIELKHVPFVLPETHLGIAQRDIGGSDHAYNQ